MDLKDLRSNSQQIKSIRPDLNLKETYNLPVGFNFELS
jgi:hypothetical protein